MDSNIMLLILMILENRHNSKVIERKKEGF